MKWISIPRNVLLVSALVIVALMMSGCANRVPNVVGLTGDEAVRVLQKQGYILGKTNVMYTTGLTPDTVTAQFPSPNERLRKGGEVSLTIAKALGSMTVPNLTGKTETEAKSILTSASLVATTVPLYSDTIAAGIVGGQVPAAGSKIDPGATVALAVSKGKTPPKVKVPKVSGMKQADAESALKKVGLVPSPYKTYSDTIAKGVVGDQSPASGSSVSPNSKVGFIVSLGKGTSTVKVPSVTGKSVGDAKTAIESAGLKSSVSYAADAKVKKDIVISQMPPSGSTTAKGGIVGIVVSTGAQALVAVPNLKGLTADKAKAAVQAAGFYAYGVDQASDAAVGTVFNQLPEAGVKVQAGWPVIYAISTGPPPQ
jgi:beta-lactam-binding protein with PASTA domain